MIKYVVSWRWNGKPYEYEANNYVEAFLKQVEVEKYGAVPTIHMR